MKPLLIAIALWAATAVAEAGDVRYGAPPSDLADNLARLKEAYPGTTPSCHESNAT